MHFSRPPTRKDAVVSPDEQATLVVDAGGDPFVAGVAPDTLPSERIDRLETSANETQAAPDDDVEIVIQRGENVGEDRRAVGWYGGRRESHRGRMLFEVRGKYRAYER